MLCPDAQIEMRCGQTCPDSAVRREQTRSMQVGVIFAPFPKPHGLVRLSRYNWPGTHIACSVASTLIQGHPALEPSSISSAIEDQAGSPFSFSLRSWEIIFMASCTAFPALSA